MTIPEIPDFPGTNLQDLNLDWLIDQMKTLDADFRAWPHSPKIENGPSGRTVPTYIRIKRNRKNAGNPQKMFAFFCFTCYTIWALCESMQKCVKFGQTCP